ncbi:MAG: hypothetical protein V4463_05335 [Pseudomonadota bacterium]
MDKYELRRLKLLEIREDRCNGKTAVLAAKLSRTDSYVSRMLYPEGKQGRKRIGEDMADLIAEVFALDRNELEIRSDAVEAPELESMRLEWTTPVERALLSLFRSTDDDGRKTLMIQATALPAILRPGVIGNKK